MPLTEVIGANRAGTPKTAYNDSSHTQKLSELAEFFSVLGVDRLSII